MISTRETRPTLRTPVSGWLVSLARKKALLSPQLTGAWGRKRRKPPSDFTSTCTSVQGMDLSFLARSWARITARHLQWVIIKHRKLVRRMYLDIHVPEFTLSGQLIGAPSANFFHHIENLHNATMVQNIYLRSYMSFCRFVLLVIFNKPKEPFSNYLGNDCQGRVIIYAQDMTDVRVPSPGPWALY